jgi:hypothetical protein
VIFAFFFLGKFFVFCIGSRQAAARCLTIVSALVPMAQMKPSSSRATAVVIFLWSLPAAVSLDVGVTTPNVRNRTPTLSEPYVLKNLPGSSQAQDRNQNLT